MKNRPFNAAIFDGEASRPFDGLKIFRCSNWSIDSSRIYNSVAYPNAASFNWPTFLHYIYSFINSKIHRTVPGMRDWMHVQLSEQLLDVWSRTYLVIQFVELLKREVLSFNLIVLNKHITYQLWHSFNVKSEMCASQKFFIHLYLCKFQSTEKWFIFSAGLVTKY